MNFCIDVNNNALTRIFLCVFYFVGIFLPVCSTQAQNPPASKLIYAELVSPGSANTYYGSGTNHTNSTGITTRAVLVKELAKSLGAGRLSSSDYQSKVFEYISENVEVEFRFGLSKGAYGALLDQSGTPFDISHLTVELLREAGISASYELGTITLTASQFGIWTGLVQNLNESTQTFTVNAASACKLLAGGGIPATVNGSTISSCSQLTGQQLTSVTLMHIWVRVGADYLDPSFKIRKLINPANFNAIFGCGSGVGPCGEEARSSTIASAQTGYDSAAQANYVENINKIALRNYIASMGQALSNYVKSINGHLRTEELIGHAISRDVEINSVDFSSPPYSVAQVYGIISGDIPDQYRTKIRVQIDNINKSIFLDEISGYDLGASGGQLFNSSTPHYVELSVSGRFSSLGYNRLILANSMRADGNAGNDDLTVLVDHPYVAVTEGSPYADEVYTHDSYIRYLHNNNLQYSSAHIEVNVGQTGRGRLQKDNDIASTTPEVFLGGLNCNGGSITQSRCAVVPMNIPAIVGTWAYQTSEIIKIAGGITKTKSDIHHVISIVSSVQPLLHMTAVSAYSIVSPSDSEDDRKSAMFAVSTVSAALEGGVYRQTQDSWLDPSSIGLFNHAIDERVRFYDANPSNINSILNASTDYGAPARSHLNDYFLHPSVSFKGVVPKKGKSQTFSTVNVSTEFLAAPFLAFDSDLKNIAYATTARNKAGGGTAPTNPLEAALSFLDQQEPDELAVFHEIDNTTGAISLVPEPDISVGFGDFPTALSFQRRFNSHAILDGIILEEDAGEGEFTLPGNKTAFSTIGLPPGWTHNFYVRAKLFSGSGTILNTSSDALYAADLVASIKVLSDLGRSGLNLERAVTAIVTGHILTEVLDGLALSVRLPEEELTFIRQLNGSYITAGDSTASINIASGQRTPIVTPGGGSTYRYEDYAITVTLEDGSKLDFSSAGYNTIIYTGLAVHAGVNEFKLDKWRFPTGVSVDYQYEYPSVVHDNRRYVLTRVSNTFGYALNFAYDDFDNAITVSDGTGRIAKLISGGQTGLNSGYFAPDPIYCFSDSNNAVSCYQYKGTVAASPLFNAYEGGLADPNFGSRARLEKVYLPGDVNQSDYSITAANPSLEISYNGLSHVASVWDQLRRKSDFYLTKTFAARRYRAINISPINAVSEMAFGPNDLPLAALDEVGRTTTFTHDAIGRMTGRVMPSGLAQVMEYDNKHNLIREQVNPAPGASGSPIIITYQYNDTNWPRKVTTVTDGRGNTTNYVYSSTTGLVTRIEEPADASGQRPVTSYSYINYGRLDTITDPVSTITKFEYYPVASTLMASHQNGELKSATVDHGGLNLTTWLTYDAIGNVISVTDPRGQEPATSGSTGGTTPPPDDPLPPYDDCGSAGQICP